MRLPSRSDAPAPVRGAFKRRGHIVLTLLAVLVVVGLGPMATMSWKLIDINREALTTAQQELQLLKVASIAHELDIHVDGFRSELLRMAQTLGGAVRGRGTLSREEILRVLDQVTDDRIPYLRYTYFHAGGMEKVSAGELPEGLEPWFTDALRDSAAIQAAKGDAHGKARVTLLPPILLDASPPRAVLLTAAPVVSRGSFSGVLTAMIDLEAVWRSVNEVDRKGVVFAVDSSGVVFASSDPDQVRPGRDLGDSELVRKFLSTERGKVTMPFTPPVDGETERYLGSFDKTRYGWGIFVQAPERVVYLPVRNMVNSTRIWALAALGLAGLAALFFARHLSVPINRLAAASRAFARGDFATRVPVRSRNELGELAHTFNIMAEELEDYIRKLKKALQENNELFMGTIGALAQAIDAKDPYTRGHSARVNRYSVIIARQLELSQAVVEEIHVASLLHDVGKIGVDDAILRKPGALTPDEFRLMKMHTVKGAEIMAPIRQMARFIPGLRSHHERADGSGYPDGLTGEMIPVMARIIAVADTFDAITTNRPYQKAMTFEAALKRLEELKGTHLDTRVVEAFKAACAAGRIQAPRGEGTALPSPAPAARGSEVPTEAVAVSATAVSST